MLGVDIAAEHDSLKEDPRFKFHQCDLTSPEAAITVVSACATTFHTPRIDALLNVAGIMDNFAAIDKFEDAAWERVMAINLTAPARLMRAVIKVMRPQKSGAILNVSSAAGESGAMAGCAYTASKHGLVSEIPCATLPGRKLTSNQERVNQEHCLVKVAPPYHL